MIIKLFYIKKDMIDITGLDKVEVLLALYKEAFKAKEEYLVISLLRVVSFEGNDHMKIAQNAIESTPSLAFDYIDLGAGELAIKVNLSRSAFDPWLYDREHGEGLAAKTINKLKALKSSTHPFEIASVEKISGGADLELPHKDVRTDSIS